MKKLNTLFVIVVVLFVLNACNLTVEEYFPITGITIFVNDDPVTGNFVFINYGGAARTFRAVVDGGNNDITISWQISGDEYVRLHQTSGETVTVSADSAGNARITVTAANPDGEVETFFDITAGTAGSRTWIFRMYENTPNGLVEINDDDQFMMLFNEERMLHLKTAGSNEEAVFTVQSNEPAGITIYEAEIGNFIIFGNERKNHTITVTAEIGSESYSRTFGVRVMEFLPLVPLHWRSEEHPAPVLMRAVTGGTAFHIPDSPYFLRAARENIPSIDGGLRLGVINNFPILVIGGGNAMTGQNTSGTNTSDTLHVPGQFNLYNDVTFRLTIYYTDAVGDPGPSPDILLRIAINNNTSGNAGSRLGALSGMIDYRTITELHEGRTRGGILSHAGTGPGRLVQYFNPSRRFADLSSDRRETLKTAFISLQTQTNSRITITGISFEQVEDD